jgi:AcrR family transcriptional regulator
MGKLGVSRRPVKQETSSPWLPRDQRSKSRDEKREAVLKTAAQLFSTQGFHKTTLTDIARQLHITKPAIYHYFSSKDEILLECTRVGLAAAESEFETAVRAGASGRERLEHFMIWFAENMTTVFGTCLVRIADQDLEPQTQSELHAAKKIIDRRLRQLLDMGIADGSIAPCNSRLAAFTIAGALNWVGHWYKPGGSWTARAAAEQVVALLVSGIAPRQDVKR